LGTKDSQEQVVGAWIIELDELDAVRKSSDWASVLSFVSRSSDRFRFSYARRVLPYPRQCVFAATTNSATYIRGESGDRRFWPVKCGPSIDLDALARDRDQIWAYHVHLYFAGVKWHVNETQDPAFVADHAEQIKERREIDPWTDDVLDFVDNSFNYMKDFLSTTEILKNCIKMPPDRMSKMDTMRIASILTLAGWTRKSVRVTDVSGKSKPKMGLCATNVNAYVGLQLSPPRLHHCHHPETPFLSISPKLYPPYPPIRALTLIKTGCHSAY
jgi:putative DNA primase/helicase